MDGSKLIFIVMAIVIRVCPRTGVAPALTAGSHPRACPGTLTSPAGPSSGRTPIRHHLIRAAVRSLPLARRR
jgi:hypothetical protein